MKKLIRFFLLFSVYFLLIAPFTTPVQAAGSVYVSPASRTVGVGERFSLSVRTNTGGDAVNGVTVNLTYPADKLDFIGISGGGSAFAIEAPSSGGGGSISISRGNINPVSGDRLIATVTFRSKANSGSGTVSVSGGTALVRASDQANIYGGGSASTITFSNKPASTPTPKASEMPPTINGVEISDIGYSSALVSWTTDRPSYSIIEYGLTNKYGVTESTETLTQTHTATLSSALLIPGTTYHLRVIGKGSETGQESTSSDFTFSTLGFSAIINVRNEHNAPLASAQVTVSSPNGPVTVQTDANGIATVGNLPPGEHVVVVKDGDATYSSSIDVLENIPEDGNSPAQPQEFEIKVAGAAIDPDKNSTLLTAALIAIPTVLALIALIIIIRKYRNNFPQY